MATIQDYLETAKAAIISGSCDRALALCHHILLQYPKHLEAHCLLAEAWRERGDTAIAEDILLRVLSADPENLIARWALSTIHSERREPDAALAHLRIAFEMHPDHKELREELVHLSGQRAKPTTGGLARLYARGGFFERAIVEFHTALTREPRRLDLLVGLAEVLWRGGHEEQAAEVCQRILDDSPDCLKALVIGAFLSPGRSRQVSLWRAAHELDPEHRLAKELAREIIGEIPQHLAVLVPPAADLADPADEALRPEVPQPVAGLTSAPTPSGTERPRERNVATAASGAPKMDSVDTVAATSKPETAGQQPYEVELAALAGRLEEAAAAARVPQFVETTPLAPVRPAVQLAAVPPDAPPPEVSAPVNLPPTPADQSTSDGDWGEWADLLGEEITLDAETEARLASALSELQPQATVKQVDETHEPVEGQIDSALAAASSQQLTVEDGESAAADQLQYQLAAVNADPNNHAERLSLARAYRAAGKPAEAVTEYRALLQTAPEMSNDVANDLRELLVADPKLPVAHRLLGDAYMKIGRFQHAIDEYNHAINLEKVAR